MEANVDHDVNDPTGLRPMPVEGATRAPLKTPMYKARHAERYQRQAQIVDLQKQTGNRLICYVAHKASILASA